MTRLIYGVMGGVFTAFLLISGSQYYSSSKYPLPEGLDMADKAAMAEFFTTLPDLAFFILLAGYALGAFFGGLVATLISKTKYLPAMIIGGFLTLAAIYVATQLPQPRWVSVSAILVMIPMAWLGARMVRTPYKRQS